MDDQKRNGSENWQFGLKALEEWTWAAACSYSVANNVGRQITPADESRALDK
jgi:hypothetical protein